MSKSNHDVLSKPSSCALLGPFGIAVQLLLASAIGTYLLLKWRCEHHFYAHRRPFGVFLLDISKPLVSATLTHGVNIGQAYLFLVVEQSESVGHTGPG